MTIMFYIPWPKQGLVTIRTFTQNGFPFELTSCHKRIPKSFTRTFLLYLVCGILRLIGTARGGAYSKLLISTKNCRLALTDITYLERIIEMEMTVKFGAYLGAWLII